MSTVCLRICVLYTTYMRVYGYACVYICMHVCLYVCVYACRLYREFLVPISSACDMWVLFPFMPGEVLGITIEDLPRRSLAEKKKA